VLKAIVSTFINGAVPPIDVLECVLVEWHSFCEFTNKHYGVAWQEQPEVPTIAYLSRNLIAAANFWATIGKQKQEQRRGELLVRALDKSRHEFGCLNKLSDPYFSELAGEIKESEAKGEDSSGLYRSLMHYLETFDSATETAVWERTNERELILTMTSVEHRNYLSQSGPSKAKWPSIIMSRLDQW